MRYLKQPDSYRERLVVARGWGTEEQGRGKWAQSLSCEMNVLELLSSDVPAGDPAALSTYEWARR